MNLVTLSILLSVLAQTGKDVANQFNWYLILGYFAMWVVCTIYVVSLASRQRNLKQDIQMLQGILREDEGPTE